MPVRGQERTVAKVGFQLGYFIMKIAPNETEIVGRWVRDGADAKSDAATRRIEDLIANHLRPLSQADGGWSVLYQDPTDGRHWQLTYPESGSQGGGAPRLAVTLD